MKKRLIIFSLLLIIFVPCLEAQKKEISQARTYIKSGKNLDKAEQMMQRLLKDSVHRQNEKIHLIYTESIRKQYDAINENMYLKKTVDTASFFNIIRKLFLANESLDTLDATPNEKGRVKPKYRAKNSMFLHTIRQNLFNGGAFFIRKQKFEDAFKMMDAYLDCSRQPLFSSYKYPENPEAAYWALYSGYKLSNPTLTLKYADIAKQDTSHLEYTLQYLCETYKSLGDTTAYVNTLKEGIERYLDYPYFFSYLVDYYTSRNQLDSALTVVEKGLEHDPERILFLSSKNNLLLNLGKYEECIKVSDKLISKDDSLAEAYYNAGVAYINMAFVLEKEKKATKKQREAILDKYRKAKPYIEKYRQLAPDKKDRWAAALYNIYYQLNMGKEFEEIDNLLRKA